MPEVQDERDPEPVEIQLRSASRLSGRLLDAQTGRPIAGGRFALDDARVVVADDQGRFEAPGLSMGNHEAYPLCPGHERRRILFDTTLRPDAKLELRIPPAGNVVGRVTDEQGKPIPGACVGFNTSGSIFSGAALWDRCGADGRFAWEGKAFGRMTRLSAGAPGFVQQEREGLVVLDGDPPPEVNFTLKRDPAAVGATERKAKPVAGRRDVSGTVVSPDSRPVADALVRWGVDPVWIAQETKTDGRGHFRLSRVPDEAGQLAVLAPKLAPAFPSVAAGGDLDLKVVLEKGTTVRGRVLEDTGAPIAGVEVIPHIPTPRSNLMAQLALHELTSKTDTDGRFVVEGVPETAATFTFLGEDLSAVRDRPLEPGDGAKNVVTMTAEGAIRGRVVDPLGHPVRNFRVLINIPKGNRPGEKVGGFFAGFTGTGVRFTSDDGTFIVSGLTAGNLHRVSALADGFGAGELDRVRSHPSNHLPPAEDLTLKLGVPHALRVRVFTTGGRPVKGVRVTLINGDPGPNARGFAWGYSDASWEDMVHGRARADGWAEFPALAFGQATVIVRSRGFARQRLGWRNGEEELLVDLPPEAAISGDVLDEQGRPLGEVFLTVRSSTGDQIAASIDPATGRFDISELAAGRYTLSVSQGIGAPAHQEQVNLEPGHTVVKEFRLSKTTAVSKQPTR
jgi:protocatechuate 3,4-dioxygenase beta subunit